MNKVQMADLVVRTIAHMGGNAVEYLQGNLGLDTHWSERRLHLEKLVLFSGALASIVLDEQRPADKKIHLVTTDETNTSKETH